MAALWATLFFAACGLAIVLRLKLNRAEQAARDLEQQVAFAARRRRTAMEFFHTLGSAFEEHISLDTLLRSITAYFMRVAQATGGVTYVVDHKENQLSVAAICGTLAGLGGRGQHTLEPAKGQLRLGEGLLGEVALSGRPVIINDCVRDTRLSFLGTGPLTIHSAIAVPLRFRDHALGVSVVVNRLGDQGETGKPFGRFEFQILEAMSLYASTAMQLTLSYLEQTEKQRVDFDLSVAGDIQRLLLPQHSPVVPGVHISGRSQPAYRVGGDHYDFIDLGNSRWGVVVADVSGKGVTGALVVAMCHSIVRSQASDYANPADAMKRFRQLLVEDIPEDRFVTMLYGILDTGTREFSFARAGHEPLLVYRAATRQVDRVSPPGGAIGLHRGERFDRILEQQTISLQPGDLLVLFTDGLTEAADAAGTEYGIERLIHLISETGHLNVRDLEEAVFNQVRAFAGDQPTADDQTLVVIKAT